MPAMTALSPTSPAPGVTEVNSVHIDIPEREDSVSSLVSPPNEKFFTPKTESPQAAFDSKEGFPRKPLLIYPEVSGVLIEGLMGLIGLCTIKQMFGQPKHLDDQTKIISALYDSNKQKIYGDIGGLISRSDIFFTNLPLTQDELSLLDASHLKNHATSLTTTGTNLSLFFEKDRIAKYIRQYVKKDYVPLFLDDDNVGSGLLESFYKLIELMVRPHQLLEYEEKEAKDLKRAPRLSAPDLSTNTVKNAINHNIAKIMALKKRTKNSEEFFKIGERIQRAVGGVCSKYSSVATEVKSEELFHDQIARLTEEVRQLSTQSESQLIQSQEKHVEINLLEGKVAVARREATLLRQERTALNERIQLIQQSISHLNHVTETPATTWLLAGLGLAVGVSLFAVGMSVVAGAAILGLTLPLGIGFAAMGSLLVMGLFARAVWDSANASTVLEQNIQAINIQIEQPLNVEQLPNEAPRFQHISHLLRVNTANRDDNTFSAPSHINAPQLDKEGLGAGYDSDYDSDMEEFRDSSEDEISPVFQSPSSSSLRRPS